MQNWQVVILTLCALFVGMMAPVLFQLRTTLRDLREEVRNARVRIDPILEDAHVAAARIRRLTDGIDGEEHNVAAVVHAAGNLAKSLERLRNTTQLASAVAVAVAAGVRAFRDNRGTGEDEQPAASPTSRSPDPTPAGEPSAVPQASHSKDSPGSQPYDFSISKPPTTNTEEMRS